MSKRFLDESRVVSIKKYKISVAAFEWTFFKEHQENDFVPKSNSFVDFPLNRSHNNSLRRQNTNWVSAII